MSDGLNKKGRKISNNLTRLVTNRDNIFRLYLVWTAVTVIAFGIFGIVPAINGIVEKASIISEMVSINSRLKEKATRLSVLETQLYSVKDEISILEGYLPVSFEPQDYLVDFVVATESVGYYLENFASVGQSKGAADISVRMFGEGDVVELLKQIEGLNKISQVDSIDLSRRSNDDNMHLNIKNFIMEKQ